MTAAPPVMAVDLGKTNGRAGLWREGHAVATVDGPGAPGLAETGGAPAAAYAIGLLNRRLHESTGCAPEVVCVGGAGATAAPDAAALLAELLHRELSVRRVGVTSDAITAHAGALGGAAGVVLSAGTGAVAVGVSRDGRCELVDGWGQWLGDDGGGAWVGRFALRAVLRARDGRGRVTALSSCAQDRYGDLTQLPATLAAGDNLAAATAAFGPDVARCAAAGDAVAQIVIDSAATVLAETTVAAAWAVQRGQRGDAADAHRGAYEGADHRADHRPEHRADHRTDDGAVAVVFVGGLAHWGDVLLVPWGDALVAGAHRVGIRVDVREPLGSSLDGAALLAARTGLPHRAQVRWFPGAPQEAA